MKIECPRCGEKVEYSPGAVQTCSYCQVSLRLPELNQLSEDQRNQWFKEQAAIKAREGKRRKKLAAEQRRRKEKEQRATLQRELLAQQEEPERQQSSMPPLRATRPTTPTNQAGPGKGLASRLVYLLDPKFERYITPQIIRVFWALSLVLAFLGVAIYALGGLKFAIPRSIEVPNTRSDEVVYRDSVLAELIAEKEFDEIMAETRPEPITEPAYQSATKVEREPVIDFAAIRADYERLSLEQLRAELVKLEKEYPSYRKQWIYQHTLLYPLWIAAAVVAAVLNLLIIRMACEFLCVIFNIATHLSELRQALPSVARE